MDKYILSVGFSKRKSFNIVSKLIRLVEGTEYSHTFITWKSRAIDRRKVFEAVGSGNRSISNHVFKEKSIITHIFKLKVDKEAIKKVEQYVHDQAGRPYGYKHILGLAWMRGMNMINRILGIKHRYGNPIKDGKYSQICVEAGAYVVELAKDIDMPGDIENYGLREYFAFIAEHAEAVPQEKIDRINYKN